MESERTDDLVPVMLPRHVVNLMGELMPAFVQGHELKVIVMACRDAIGAPRYEAVPDA